MILWISLVYAELSFFFPVGTESAINSKPHNYWTRIRIVYYYCAPLPHNYESVYSQHCINKWRESFPIPFRSLCSGVLLLISFLLSFQPSISICIISQFLQTTWLFTLHHTLSMFPKLGLFSSLYTIIKKYKWKIYLLHCPSPAD